MRLFLDSPALAKRYIQERGTKIVLESCSNAKEIFLSILCIPETISACNRLLREKKMPVKAYRELKEALSGDVNTSTLVTLDYSVLRGTILCLEKTPVRTLDAIQIASAKVARCDLFLTADSRQAVAATTLDLKVLVV